MATKYYADVNGIDLGGFSEDNPAIPSGAVETTGPSPNRETSTWNVSNQQWDGDILTWDQIRDIRHPLIHEVVEILDQYRNELEFSIATKINSTKAQEWADYLQVLRDIPDLTINTSWNGPDDVVWPTKPT